MVLSKSRFYSKLWTGRWDSLPVVSKRILMDNFADWNTYGISLEEAREKAAAEETGQPSPPCTGGLTAGFSTGTSGERWVFLVSPKESAEWAGTVIARIVRRWGAAHRIALFLGSDSRLYRAVRNARHQFRFFDAKGNVDAGSLEEFRPTILAAPPLVLRKLCRTKVKINPEQVISVADVLEERDKTYFENFFGSKCDEIYQATEGFLASSCTHGRLHWNEDALIVEKERVGGGYYCPVITDFRRITQPVLKLRLDDILVDDSGVCPCGSIFGLVGAVAGRSDEVLKFEGDGGEAVRLMPDSVRRAVSKVLDPDTEYRVIQTGAGRIEIHLSEEAIFPHVQAAFSDFLRGVGVGRSEIVLSRYEVEDGESKARRVRRQT